jgi:hypothetical protein
MADRLDQPPQIVHASDEHAVQRRLPAAAGVSRRRRARTISTPHTNKFRAVTAALVGVGIGAIVVAVAILSTTTTHSPPVAWSSWSPPDSGTLGAREIADHVAPFYRVSAVDQLAVVTVVNLSNPSAAAAASSTGTASTSGLQVAVKADPSSSAVSLLSGNTIAYNLCGIGGSNCAIGVGQTSTSRLLLLRREALELALYAFKYIGGVENVVAVLPPGHTQQTSALTKTPPTSNAPSTVKPVDIAVLFVREELQPWLKLPLSATLAEPFPPSVAQMSSAPEAGLVDQITARGLFSEQLVQAQDGSNLIVLNPLPPQ